MKTLHEEASSMYFPVAASKKSTSENPAAFASIVGLYTYKTKTKEKQTLQFNSRDLAAIKSANPNYENHWVRIRSWLFYRWVVRDRFDPTCSTRSGSMELVLYNQAHWCWCLRNKNANGNDSFFSWILFVKFRQIHENGKKLLRIHAKCEVCLNYRW